ncbi:MAG: TipAS antibiotic-recognition domain-containing protein [Dehalococcoidia bacterium]
MNQFSPDEFKRWEEHGKGFTPEQIQAIQDDWTALYAEARSNPDLDPASPAAQALLDRHDALLARTFAGNTELMNLTKEKYQAGVFEEMPEAPKRADFAFFDRIREARRQP